jgi:hypothetical protein
MFGILFIYLFAIAYFWSLSLGANNFRNLQELDFQDFEQQPVGEQVKWPLTILFQYAFSIYYTQGACINWLPKSSYFRIGFLWLAVMLSSAVLSHRTSLSFFMMLSLTCVECWDCWSSMHRDVRWSWWDSMLWFEQGLEWWRRLESVRWYGLSCSNLLRTEL